MNSYDELHIVLGGNGGLGSAVVRELLYQGKRVRSVSRSVPQRDDLGDEVEFIQGDITDFAQIPKICQGASVIYHCTNVLYPDWVKFLPPMMEGVIMAAKTSGAKVVYGDNLYMYGQVSVPITPDLPDKAQGHKGRVRAEIANKLMEAHKNGTLRATIGRGSDFYGPRVLNAMMGEVVFQALVEGKPLQLIGKLDVPHTYTFVEDFARGLVTLGEKEEALGEIWHIPSAETITTGQFLELIFEIAQQRPKIQVASPLILSLLGLFSPMLRELKEMIYEFDHPFIVDHSKYEQAFGCSTTPHREAIAKTLDWFRQHYAKKSV